MLTFVATILTQSNSVGKPWRPQFEASCQRVGLQPEPLKLKDFNPSQGNLKLKALATACIERRRTYSHVLFLDGFDSIVLDGLDELNRRFLKFNHPMVVAGAATLVPKVPTLFPYPLSESGSPFIYPRANIFMAELPHFLRLLSQFSLQETRGPFVENEWFQHVRSVSPGAFTVDADTNLFITLDGVKPDMFDVVDGRVVNTVTNSMPSIVHASGTFDFSAVLLKLAMQGRHYLGGVKPTLRSVTPAYGDPEDSRLRLKTTVQRPWCCDYASAWKTRISDAVEIQDKSVVRKLAELRAGKLAVDFGAGAGLYTPCLEQKFDRVVAVDVSKEALDKLRKKHPKVRLEVISGPQISAVQDDEVNLVFAWDVLSFVDFYDLAALLGEFKRILAVDGQVIANFCNLRSPHNDALLSGDSPSTGAARIRPYTRDMLRLLFSKHGFTVTGLTEDGASLVVVARKRSAVVRNVVRATLNFYHSGDAGDVIYALPVIKALGGGRLYLGPVVNIKYEAGTRLRMTEAAYENLRQLIEAQPYIHSCHFADIYPEGLINYNLNEFRIWLIDHQTGNYWNNPTFKGTLSLSKVHLETFGLSDKVDESEPWLTITEKAALPDGCDIVVARSQRYNNLRFPWPQIVGRYGHRMCFVGLDAEYAEFTAVAGKVKIHRVQTANLYEAAKTIAAARLFIGNQSCPFAIAEGFKLPAVQETWDHDPNCMFNRNTALYQCENFATIEQFMLRFLTL